MTQTSQASAVRAAWQGRRVLVTGGGFVGSNFVPKLRAIGCDAAAPRRADSDLLNQRQV